MRICRDTNALPENTTQCHGLSFQLSTHNTLTHWQEGGEGWVKPQLFNVSSPHRWAGLYFVILCFVVMKVTRSEGEWGAGGSREVAVGEKFYIFILQTVLALVRLPCSAARNIVSHISCKAAILWPKKHFILFCDRFLESPRNFAVTLWNVHCVAVCSQ